LSHIPHVVILGGGFGGLAAANEIRNTLDSSKVKITIIDKKDWFMVGYAKLWIMNGTRTFENSIGSLNELPKKQINFIKDEIIEINPENNFVKTKSGNISFDFLIISMGAVLAPEKISGLIENGFNLYDHNQLNEINQKLNKIESGKIAIVIMGMPYKCPPAPFEASLLVDSMLRKRGIRDSVQIDFYSPAPITLPAAGPEVSKKILDLVNSEKITFHNSQKIKRVESKKLIFENDEYHFDILLAIPPHIAPKVIYDSNLAKEPGFIPIDRNCKTPFENIFAVGDVTSLSVTDSIVVPKAGIFAEGEGITVAKNIISKLESKETSVLFDGKGGCFLESGRDTASVLEVDMFTNEKPSTKLTESTKDNLSKKLDFEKERLSKWL
jgi:sulfide:quinone oxidoreductase